MPERLHIPAVLITSLAVLCSALLFLIFRTGLIRAGIANAQRKRALLFAAAGTSLWFVATAVLAQTGFFSNFQAMPPRLLFALLLPAIILIIAVAVSDTLSAALKNVPLTWLIYLQMFRILVELNLFQGYRLGAIPMQMTFEGRNFDILAGLTAPIAAWLLSRTKNRTIGIVWNLAGLALLLNIVVVALLSMPTRFRMFTGGPANTLLTHFPFIFLPAVLVPIAYTAHVLSLRQLCAKR